MAGLANDQVWGAWTQTTLTIFRYLLFLREKGFKRNLKGQLGECYEYVQEINPKSNKQHTNVLKNPTTGMETKFNGPVKADFGLQKLKNVSSKYKQAVF